MGKANIGLIFLNYDTSTSLPPMGRLLDLGVDEKGGWLPLLCDFRTYTTQKGISNSNSFSFLLSNMRKPVF